MDFKSRISTTREQSKRLLDLGLNPETADMHYIAIPTFKADTLQVSTPNYLDLGAPMDGDVPSWSLSRLLEMMPHSIEQSGRPNADLNINTDGKCWIITYEEFGYDIKYQVIKRDLFNALVDMIKCLIGECYFNQDYLIHSNSSNTGKEETK